MSLIDDARRLADAGSYDDGGNGSYNEPSCIHCHSWPEDQHEPTCPWLALPRIVAALEAAQALLKAVDTTMVGHGPTTIKRGPYKRPDDPETIDVCMAYCATYPCEAALMGEPAEALREAMRDAP